MRRDIHPRRALANAITCHARMPFARPALLQRRTRPTAYKSAVAASSTVTTGSHVHHVITCDGSR